MGNMDCLAFAVLVICIECHGRAVKLLNQAFTEFSVHGMISFSLE